MNFKECFKKLQTLKVCAEDNSDTSQKMEQKWLRQEQMGKMEWKSQHTEKVLKS